jgi:hypothetical protein
MLFDSQRTLDGCFASGIHNGLRNFEFDVDPSREPQSGTSQPKANIESGIGIKQPKVNPLLPGVSAYNK